MPYLLLNSWAGQKRVPVEKLGVSRTKYRVKLLCECRLPNQRWYKAGDTAWVPKTAVRE